MSVTLEESFTITSVGDISLAGGFADHPELFTEWIDEDICSALAGDIRIGNMEFVLLPEGEENPGGLCLAEPAQCFRALMHAGFNLLTLGNNHILDFKRGAGLRATIQAIEDAGIKHCGAGMNITEARKPAVMEIGGVRIAVFSRCHAPSFVNIMPMVASETEPGVALLDVREIEQSVQEYKQNQGCDLAILCPHWGIQQIEYPQPSVYRMAARLLHSGVDLILGVHSHTLQGLARFNDRFVFFGQGNFYFYPFLWNGKPIHTGERDRTAAISRFRYTGGVWDVEVIPTIQKPDERISRLPSEKSEEISYRIFNVWNQYHPWRFHKRWRSSEAGRLRDGLLSSLRDRNWRGALWYANPVNWFGMLWRIVVKPRWR